MTMADMERRLLALESEVKVLRGLLLRVPPGVDYIPGFGVVGTFKDDPTFDEAVRLGREYRDKVNRESLEEMDREAAEEAAASKAKKRKPRKANARS